jgi:hypothetical protein
MCLPETDSIHQKQWSRVRFPEEWIDANPASGGMWAATDLCWQS